MSYRENALIIKTSCLAEGIYEMWLKRGCTGTVHIGIF